MKIRLKELNLKNFKGLDLFALSVNGNPSTAVYGDNATGKTTLFDAWSWLLFGKDSLNSATFEIKPLYPTGEHVHNLEHEVAGIIEADGRPVTLKKVYSEKWTKKRGAAKREFTGHQVDHFIDGVPVKEKEFKARIDTLCPENVFRVISNPRYFADVMHWQDRRKMLFSVCGDVTDAEVMASNEKLAGLPEIVGEHAIDDYRKIIKARMPEVNRELEKIPTRIDEVKQGLPIAQGTEAVIRKELADLESSKSKILQRIQEAKNGGNIANLTVELRTLEAERQRLLNEFAAGERAERAANDEKKQVLQKAYRDAARRVDELRDAIDARRRAINADQEALHNKDAEIEAARDQWYEFNGQAFAGETVCPSCGQNLPCDQIAAAKEKFNGIKAAKLKAINDVGKSLKEKRDAFAARMEQTRQAIETLQTELAEAEKIAAKTKADRDSFEPIVTFGTRDLRLLEIEKYIDGQKKKIEADKPDTSALEQNVRDIDASIQIVNRKLADIETISRSHQRMAALGKEEKALAEEYEGLEEQLFMIEEFIRAKVRLMETKINSRFFLVTFRLFKENINGSLDECCDVSVNGVPWGSLNNAARINAGLDICNTMAAHYDVTVPIFIDNAESVTDIFKTEAQQIRLIVSEPDKTLRVQ